MTNERKIERACVMQHALSAELIDSEKSSTETSQSDGKTAVSPMLDALFTLTVSLLFIFFSVAL